MARFKLKVAFLNTADSKQENNKVNVDVGFGSEGGLTGRKSR